ncbi:hypothetical protein [Algoriphagus antarcticus]|uniref:Uncharacterized protein n=1 Tax=Algoriphagus antarcticus TaxID=238540 RepID=A0A3E0DTX1_9BACT|nr:hypothetical protein [Algoriphagus antarcticus]REG86358.1 hypothetical protein C8N25_11262 [Algoriphagus antarcticus]
MINFLFFVGSVLLVLSCITWQDNQTVPASNPVSDPEMNSLNDPADTIQQTRIILTEVLKPIRIKVPTQSIGSYSHTNESCTLLSVNLLSPICQNLPYLHEESDQIIKNSFATPYIQKLYTLSAYVFRQS